MRLEIFDSNINTQYPKPLKLKRTHLSLLNRFLYWAVVLVLFSFQSSFANNEKVSFDEPKAELIYPLLVDKFYQQRQNKLFWFAPGAQAAQLRQQLRSLIEREQLLSLDKDNFHYIVLHTIVDSPFMQVDSSTISLDRLYTDAAIALSKSLFTGTDIMTWMRYDAISKTQADVDNDYIIKQLLTVKSAGELNQFFNSLEPQKKEYVLLKAELRAKLQQNDTLQQNKRDVVQVMKLISSMNFFRWIHHFNFDKYIVVNIASTTLSYYENGSVQLNMKVVAGKIATPTPCFATYCNEVILYPYWNVPHSIAVHELLPLFKRRPTMIDAMNMQIIDKNGIILNPDSIKWSSLNKKNFPYKFRQSTGCDNALGVMKFNLTTPFSIYMHDTNVKTVFQSDKRYLSHGCIRLEKPIALGNYLLYNKLDTTFLKACYKNQEPVSVALDKPIPVFVVYITAQADSSNKVEYYKDTYSLIKVSDN
ncbi:L,D-transpeptidase family protein [Solitalea koreensis]|uniref:L,D-transpeptidase catalytic domain n=1 Tax=Solitalea koreensis TaxID=543615 RepID=A0A521DE70_9SPHI|nr:L,D-transpeptidase family protein [Solitalea koreensis]SMO69943.1 L,D-transpeptidase catalytic domain [Solitalea koreensis]